MSVTQTIGKVDNDAPLDQNLETKNQRTLRIIHKECKDLNKNHSISLNKTG
jgi:hypothetical protein